MGTRERQLVESAGIALPELIELLNKAFADEWLAYYQYWLGAKVAVGVPKETVVNELMEHATDELRHADMLSNRIIQLGGTPILEPKDWYTMANCQYAAPKDPDIRTLLDQNIHGEQCAIGVYSKLITFTKDRDPVTYNIVLQILEDEIEHEEDLEALKEDIRSMLGWK